MSFLKRAITYLVIFSHLSSSQLMAAKSLVEYNPDLTFRGEDGMRRCSRLMPSDDNSCAFWGLLTSAINPSEVDKISGTLLRVAGASELLKNAKDETVRRLIAPEIKAAIIGADPEVVPIFQSQGDFAPLSKAYWTTSDALDKAVRALNAVLKATKSAAELLDQDASALDPRFTTLRQAREAHKAANEALLEWAAQEDVYRAFVEHFVAKPGVMIGTLMGQTGTLDALARVFGINFRIYQENGAPSRRWERSLKLVHEFCVGPDAETVELLHTKHPVVEDGVPKDPASPNHFDRLEREDRMFTRDIVPRTTVVLAANPDNRFPIRLDHFPVGVVDYCLGESVVAQAFLAPGKVQFQSDATHHFLLGGPLQTGLLVIDVKGGVFVQGNVSVEGAFLSGDFLTLLATGRFGNTGNLALNVKNMTTHEGSTLTIGGEALLDVTNRLFNAGTCAVEGDVSLSVPILQNLGTLSARSLRAQGEKIDNSGTLKISSGLTLAISGEVSNRGSVEVQDACLVTDCASLRNVASWIVHGDCQVGRTGHWLNQRGGRWEVDGILHGQVQRLTSEGLIRAGTAAFLSAREYATFDGVVQGPIVQIDNQGFITCHPATRFDVTHYLSLKATGWIDFEGDVLDRPMTTKEANRPVSERERALRAKTPRGIFFQSTNGIKKAGKVISEHGSISLTAKGQLRHLGRTEVGFQTHNVLAMEAGRLFVDPGSFLRGTTIVLSAKEFLRQRGEVQADDLKINAPTLIQGGTLDVKGDLELKGDTVTAEKTSVMRARNAILKAKQKLDHQGALKVEEQVIMDARAIELGQTSKVQASNAVLGHEIEMEDGRIKLKPSETVKQKGEMASGESFMVKGKVLENYGCITAQNAQFNADRLFFNGFGGTISAENLSVNALVSVNFLGWMHASKNMQINALLDANLLGGRSAQNMHVNAFVSLQMLGGSLPYFSSVEDILTPQNLLRAGISLGNIFLPQFQPVFSGVQMLQSGFMLARGCLSFYDTASKVDFSTATASDLIPLLCGVKDLCVSAHQLYSSTHSLNLDRTNDTSISIPTERTWSDYGLHVYQALAAFGPHQITSSLLNVNLGLNAGVNAHTLSVFNLDAGINVFANSYSSNSVWSMHEGINLSPTIGIYSTNTAHVGGLAAAHRITVSADYTTLDAQIAAQKTDFTGRKELLLAKRSAIHGQQGHTLHGDLIKVEGKLDTKGTSAFDAKLTQVSGTVTGQSSSSKGRVEIAAGGRIASTSANAIDRVHVADGGVLRGQGNSGAILTVAQGGRIDSGTEATAFETMDVAGRVDGASAKADLAIVREGGTIDSTGNNAFDRLENAGNVRGATNTVDVLSQETGGTLTATVQNVVRTDLEKNDGLIEGPENDITTHADRKLGHVDGHVTLRAPSMVNVEDLVKGKGEGFTFTNTGKVELHLSEQKVHLTRAHDVEHSVDVTAQAITTDEKFHSTGLVHFRSTHGQTHHKKDVSGDLGAQTTAEGRLTLDGDLRSVQGAAIAASKTKATTHGVIEGKTASALIGRSDATPENIPAILEVAEKLKIKTEAGTPDPKPDTTETKTEAGAQSQKPEAPQEKRSGGVEISGTNEKRAAVIGEKAFVIAGKDGIDLNTGDISGIKKRIIDCKGDFRIKGSTEKETYQYDDQNLCHQTGKRDKFVPSTVLGPAEDSPTYIGGELVIDGSAVVSACDMFVRNGIRNIVQKSTYHAGYRVNSRAGGLWDGIAYVFVGDPVVGIPKQEVCSQVLIGTPGKTTTVLSPEGGISLSGAMFCGVPNFHTKVSTIFQGVQLASTVHQTTEWGFGNNSVSSQQNTQCSTFVLSLGNGQITSETAVDLRGVQVYGGTQARLYIKAPKVELGSMTESCRTKGSSTSCSFSLPNPMEALPALLRNVQALADSKSIAEVAGVLSNMAFAGGTSTAMAVPTPLLQLTYQHVDERMTRPDGSFINIGYLGIDADQVTLRGLPIYTATGGYIRAKNLEQIGMAATHGRSTTQHILSFGGGVPRYTYTQANESSTTWQPQQLTSNGNFHFEVDKLKQDSGQIITQSASGYVGEVQSTSMQDTYNTATTTFGFAPYGFSFGQINQRDCITNARSGIHIQEPSTLHVAQFEGTAADISGNTVRVDNVVARALIDTRQSSHFGISVPLVAFASTEPVQNTENASSEQPSPFFVVPTSVSYGSNNTIVRQYTTTSHTQARSEVIRHDHQNVNMTIPVLMPTKHTMGRIYDHLTKETTPKTVQQPTQIPAHAEVFPMVPPFQSSEAKPSGAKGYFGNESRLEDTLLQNTKKYVGEKLTHAKASIDEEYQSALELQKYCLEQYGYIPEWAEAEGLMLLKGFTEAPVECVAPALKAVKLTAAACAGPVHLARELGSLACSTFISPHISHEIGKGVANLAVFLGVNKGLAQDIGDITYLITSSSCKSVTKDIAGRVPKIMDLNYTNAPFVEIFDTTKYLRVLTDSKESFQYGFETFLYKPFMAPSMRKSVLVGILLASNTDPYTTIIR